MFGAIKQFVCRLIPVVFLASAVSSVAQDAVVLNYKGHLRVHGTPFSGIGHFMFALENQSGEIFWSSGDFPYAGAVANPTNDTQISVNNGEYVARLGASAGHTPALHLAELRRAQKPRLIIWFNDGTDGWQRAGEDVPLDAMMASLDAAGNRPMSVAQGDALLQELRNVRSLLEQQNRPAQPAAPQPAPPAFATVTLTGPSLGRADAPLTLVEFTDYQCPFCKRFDDDVFPQLVRKYVDAGQLRIFSRNLPLPFHPYADPAAQAALCAEQQDKYWLMREKLFGMAGDLSNTNILRAAGTASLDVAKFKTCWEAKTFDADVKKDGKEAGAAGISGTPSFVLGKPAGDKLSGVIIVGAQPLAAFEAEIQKLLPPAK